MKYLLDIIKNISRFLGPPGTQIFSILVEAIVNFMVSRIDPIAPLLLLIIQLRYFNSMLLMDHFGPIRDILKSSVVVTRIEKCSIYKQGQTVHRQRQTQKEREGEWEMELNRCKGSN